MVNAADQKESWSIADVIESSAAIISHAIAQLPNAIKPVVNNATTEAPRAVASHFRMKFET